MAATDPWKDILVSMDKIIKFDYSFLLETFRSATITDKAIKPDYYLIMWQQLHRWIPDGLQHTVNENFGRSIKYPHFWLANPFKSARVPCEESEFSNPFETLNKTFAMYFTQGIYEVQSKALFWHAMGTANGKMDQVKQLFGLTTDLDIDSHKKEMTMAFNDSLLHRDRSLHQLAVTSLLGYLTQVAVPRDLKYYRRSIKSNALSMASRFKNLMGYSATLPNDFILPERLRKPGNIKWDHEVSNQILVRKGVAASQENLQVAFAKLKNEVRASIIDSILSKNMLTTVEISKFYDQISPFLVATEASIATLYDGELTETDTIEVVQKYETWLKDQAMILMKTNLVDELICNRLSGIFKSIESVPIEPKRMPWTNNENLLSVQSESFAKAYTQKKLLSQLDSNQYYSLQGFEIQFSIGLDADLRTDVKLPFEGPFFQFRDFISKQMRLDYKCIDDKIWLTPDFVYVSHGAESEPINALWRPFQKPVQSLLWIEKGGSQSLVVCSPNDAANLLKRIRRKVAGTTISLVDLKGSVYASSDPAIKKIEDETFKRLLRQVSILFGSYPLIKSYTSDFSKEDAETLNCFGNILSNHSLSDKHAMAAWNDSDFVKLFELEPSVSTNYRGAVYAHEYGSTKVEKIDLNSDGKDIAAALYNGIEVISDGIEITWKDFYKKIEEVSDSLTKNSRPSLESVEGFCSIVMGKVREVLAHPERSEAYVKKRVQIINVVKAIIDVRNKIKFLRLDESLTFPNRGV